MCVKTHVMEGLHFGFQMCELSCCLSLRWSLSVCLRAHSESSHPALDLLRIASVLTDHSPDPQKHVKVKPHHFSRTEQLTKESAFSYSIILHLSFKQPLKCLPFFHHSQVVSSLWVIFSISWHQSVLSEIQNVVSTCMNIYIKIIKKN